jgi:tetratricopeptide (TPR) repeat protein
MNKIMRRLAAGAILAAVTAAVPKVWAQSDAAEAYQQGKTAFAAGQFDKANDLFTKASQTDPKNPEVFLWLGKSQYQLGHLDEAVKAWDATLRFAPNEPYAAQMLKALRHEIGDVDSSLAVVEELIKSQLWQPALVTLDKVLRDHAISDAQRVKAMTLRADAALETGAVAEAESTARELLLKYPQLVDGDQANLLIARAELHGDRKGEGAAMLAKIIAAHPDSAAGISGAYALLSYNLSDSPTAANADALAMWVAAHPKHALATRARAMLVESDLEIAKSMGPVTAESPLNPYDLAALRTADGLLKENPGAAMAHRFTQMIVERLGSFRSGDAAIGGARTLLKSPLPPGSRLMALQALAGFEVEFALRGISREVESGKTIDATLPKPLATAIETLSQLAKEFPAEANWRLRVHLADRLRGIGERTAWPARPTELKAAQQWAVAVALPVVQGDPDAAAVDGAVKVITQIINETSAMETAAGPHPSLAVNTQLLAALPRENGGWSAVAMGQIGLLDKIARAEFAENARVGKLAENGKLSAVQEQYIATLGLLVSQSAGNSGMAIERLRASLEPWVEAGYYEVAEAAYGKLADVLPDGQKRQIQLAIVRLWTQKAIVAEQKLVATGAAPPRALDASLSQAIATLYGMQAGVGDAEPFLAQVRQEIDTIIAHYEQLKYYDIAEAAIAVKPKQANPQAATYQQFLLAKLADNGARREMATLLKQYKATDKIKLTDKTQAAIALYEKFMSDHATDPLAVRAAEAIFTIASDFEQYGAYDVAAGIDRDFAAFAAKQPVFAQASPGKSSIAEKAAFAAVTVSDVKARAAMAKATAKSAQENKGRPVPPVKISDEFAAAIKAYTEFIAAAPESPFVAQAVLRLNAIALDYARADAWEVADGIYGQILAGKLATGEPERIQFSRGMCQIGKVMPEHAKEVLGALLSPRSGGMDSANNGTFTRLDDFDKLSVDRRSKGLAAGGTAVAGVRIFDAAKPMSKAAALAPLDTASATGPAANQPSFEYREGGGGGGAFGGVAAADARSRADGQVLAAITQQESRRATQIAALREKGATYSLNSQLRDVNRLTKEAKTPQGAEQPPSISEEELARQQVALDGAYKLFESILAEHPESPTAEQARGEIMIEMDYWRGIEQWQRAAAMGEKFLVDHPTDLKLPQLRLAIATDHLSWASRPLDAHNTSQEMLVEVSKRFNAARAELAKVTTDFPEERTLIEDAQWRIANSFLTQARAVDAFSATLARGQFVRAAKELRRVAAEYAQHPQIGSIPQMLWDISMELHQRNYHEEALSVWNAIAIDYPTHPLAQQSQVMTAQTYQSVLGRPLRAAEVYLEINFAHGGNDAAMQNAVFAIGTDLKNQKRWIESLRVLENFVQSFPRHAQAGQAIAMIGQIHQANDAWQDAILAYRRVITEFPASGQWVQDAKWAIADCTINLSKWKDAVAAYESYVASFPQDGKVAEANRRIGILKDLANYQKLVDEKGPKAYDAQFQVAAIVNSQLSNWRKAVEEYQKVATNWPKTHLAADALHALGLLYLQNGEVDEARTALRAVAASYPDSPFACDSLFQIGKSYEDEANRLSTVTRAVTLEQNKDVAQRRAYISSNTTLNLAKNQLNEKVQELRASGKKEAAELQMAQNGGNFAQLSDANISIAVDNANREQEDQTAGQLADRQDKINAALRKAVAVYAEAAKVPAGDKAGEALLHMAVIYNDRLGDSGQAMSTWLEIVRQFSGTAVAEEASWQIAQHYEKGGQYAEAVEAYKSFLRNYRRSPKASEAQFFIAENYEHLGQWISAMDQYTNYVQNFPEGTLMQKAKEQISFIKTYRL